MNKMFDFKELLKIFKTNWKNILNEILPKNNPEIIDENFANNFFSGAIISIISSIINILLYSAIYNQGTLKIGVMVVGMIIINNYKNKKVNSTTLFIIFIISSLGMLGSFLSCILCMPSIIYGLIFYGLNNYITILCFVFDIIAYAFITVACIDFCKKARKSYDEVNRVVKEEAIKLKTIDVNDVSIHANKSCPNCNSTVNVDDLFCPNCGKKLK